MISQGIRGNLLFKGVIKGGYGINADSSDYSSKTSGQDPTLMYFISLKCIPSMIPAQNVEFAVSNQHVGVQL